MKPLPNRLESFVSTLESLDRADRIQMLIDTAGHFKSVPSHIAQRPFAAEHRVPGCESEAYVWSESASNDTLNFYFAVENPQGISAMALAAILSETVSGATVEQVASISPEIIYRIFGRELSMGKSLGLMGMVNMVRVAALRQMQSAEANNPK